VALVAHRADVCQTRSSELPTSRKEILTRFVAETLKYVMKPTNLLDWGPSQVAEFNALGRTKLRECYGELRGLVGEIDGDGEDQLGMEPEERPLVEGQPCPECGLPLTACWLSREALGVTREITKKLPDFSVPCQKPPPMRASD
jgi:hypothetical protein